ncbi:dihydrolipoyl dehydrogenase [Saccharospirillum salsuginis]|uniref:Dihydrolipoyl dehydrogenase n=1 Tax=Saccharospirillum salsuginis TaxID=418750 RepID=A0A918K8C6_9GAMM|nr:dihydrolipoyl dehydrogenase [Saccharospirillum salsuginis]GGX54703.1 dihydrolipoyl dehydrogenase [Saccharospirillum salsuginis]
MQFDFPKMVARSREVAGTLNKGVTQLLKKNKVTVYAGHAQLKGQGTVEVDSDTGKETLASNSIVLATGARARSLPGLEPDGNRVWTYKEAMTPATLPKSVLVMGAGAIGIEFASFYNSLGVDVTVVEAMSRILPVEDAEISNLAEKAFRQKGIRILTDTRVTELRKGADSVTAEVETPNGAETVEADRVISAVGVVGNSENIGLENTRAEAERSFIQVDEWSRTAEPGLYAIGDVAGAPCLAHKASHEAVICVEKIAGVEGLEPLDRDAVPGCTYSSPQIASVGLSEDRAKEQGHTVRVGRFPFKANGKAIAMGETDGLVKTVFDEDTGELLGAHMIGPEVTEMIQGYVVARQLETTEHELMHAIFPHPTLSESMHEATLDAYGKVLHI